MPRLAPPVGPAGRLLSLGLAVLATLLGAARGQSAPSTPSAPATSPAAPPGSAAFRSSPVTEIPFCGTVMVTSPKCSFNNLPGNKAQISLARPRATVMDMLSTAVHNVAASRNGLRTLVQGTFPVNPRRPTSYRPNGGPAVTVVGTSGGSAFSRTADLILSREKSILFSAAGKSKYRVRVQRGGNNDDIGSLGKGRCSMYIRAACADCPDGQANFGSGCVAATATSAVCPEGQTDLGSGCVDVCPDGQADFGSGSCTPAAKESECIQTVDVAFASTPADYQICDDDLASVTFGGNHAIYEVDASTYSDCAGCTGTSCAPGGIGSITGFEAPSTVVETTRLGASAGATRYFVCPIEAHCLAGAKFTTSCPS